MHLGVGCEAVNLGTGVGYSVFDLVKCMEEASGKHIPYKVLHSNISLTCQYIYMIPSDHCGHALLLYVYQYKCYA
jgi:hypothetical protein